MNAQHKINLLGNRLSRIARRLTELNCDREAEIIRAERSNRDPALGYTLAQINRLEMRAISIVEVLRANP